MICRKYLERGVTAMSYGVAALLAALGAAAAFVQDAKVPQPFEGLSCEVHVWGFGRPNFRPKSSMLVKYTPPSKEDLANPSSTVNVFNTAKRAETLSDVQITALFPGAKNVKIVHHAEMVDLDKTPLATIHAPLGERRSDCYADLAIANLYAIFPNPDRPYEQYGLGGGTVASLLAGSDRLVIDFWFQQWPNGKAQTPYVVRRKNDSPLPHVQPLTAAMLDAARASADLNLANFVATVNGRRNR